MILGFFTFIFLLLTLLKIAVKKFKGGARFRSLLGFSSPQNRNSNHQDYRNIVRGGGVNGADGTGNAYRRNGGGNGGGRNIGGLPTSSGVAPPQWAVDAAVVADSNSRISRPKFRNDTPASRLAPST
ncbi:Protein CBG13771 [Caenorhabditis briggsae]|uniref:Protein CBG13771 n=1 Tax=Caenorhabditis briggsae TaxID=6238 RepID=A8XIN5_CAEBR|nr:Protein CBG13771 [Caenorhabditis briggsae]CAP32510.1 Protein CBG13771 [Caenorhabditis briggsae]